jgi:phosphomannomutase
MAFVPADQNTLQASLTYEPRELNFGTSGRRGKVVDLTQLEVYINASAELEYLQSLGRGEGGIVKGDDFFFASDLRPSSTRFVPEEGGRGEIAQAIVSAIRDAGMKPVNMGRIPTPALMSYAVARDKGSIMVTGSHIPFDRNGYKANTSQGELLKHHEGPIHERVRETRRRLYAQPAAESLFDERGMFRSGHQDLPEEQGEARAAWMERFTSFFAGLSLRGRRLLVYQHSAVGRDLLVEVLERLGAEVVAAGRSDTFVAIDTENIGAPQLATIQALANEHGSFHAIVSTDGDSDRPLILGMDGGTGKVHFFGGDLVGMVVAEYLNADAVVVPITCNDAIDRGSLAPVVEPKTMIGSPYVIAGMEQARARGKKRVCGWEPNGGFLTGSDIERNGSVLPALMTRDALLPILGVLFAAVESGLPLIDLFARLPKRYSRAALLEQFPRSRAVGMLDYFRAHEDRLAEFFPAASGFGAIAHIDYTDGLRILFENGDVAHLRPSGNADELRIYAVADSQERADAITAMGVAVPDGTLHRMARCVY